MYNLRVGGLCLLLFLLVAVPLGSAAETPGDEAAGNTSLDQGASEPSRNLGFDDDEFFETNAQRVLVRDSVGENTAESSAQSADNDTDSDAGKAASQEENYTELDEVGATPSAVQEGQTAADIAVPSSDEGSGTVVTSGNVVLSGATVAAEALDVASNVTPDAQSNQETAEVITPDMIGNITSGDNLTGNFSADMAAAVALDAGNVSGNVTPDMIGNVTPDMIGNLSPNENVTGNVTPENLTAEDAEAEPEEVAEEIDEELEEEVPLDRIWREGISEDVYTWSPLSFSGFFYDIDEKVGTERLTIKLSKSGDGYNRKIDSGDLIYSSKVQPIEFEFSGWGKYEVLGFMADKYFAGYRENDVMDRDLSLINDNQLRRVLIDSDKEETITSGSVLALEEGYELRIKQIDINGNKVWLGLAKDGEEIDSKVVSPDGAKSSTYTYEEEIGGRDTPLVMAHVETVFSGPESSLVTIDGLFQISDTYTSVEEGDKYGEMEVVSVSDNGIEMENEDSFTLRRDKIVSFMENVAFQVADSDKLRFAPFVERTGSYEVRGTIVDPSKVNEFVWSPYNFEGFYYDINDDVGTERLEARVSESRIIEGDLIYETSPQSVDFDFNDWGTYDVIGFMADKYFAGYNNGSKFTDEFSAINEGELRKILMDNDDDMTLSTGSVMSLEEGYEIRIKQVDLDGNKVWLAVTKDGEEVADKVINPTTGEVKSKTFVYEVEIGSEEVPIIAVTVDSVFRGGEADLATIKGVFQVSDSPESVEEGETHGKMKVEALSDGGIVMENDGSISLGRGKEVEIMGNLKFKVADNSDRNFAPIAERIAKKEPLRISAPEVVVPDTATIEITSGGKAVSGVKVLVDGSEIGSTDAGGIVKYRPKAAGTFRVEAKLSGYDDASSSIVVRSQAEAKRLVINVPPEVVKGESFLITVTGGLNLTPIEGSSVFFDTTEIGITNAQGTVTHVSEEIGEHTVKATKEDFDDVTRNLTVISPIEVQELSVSESPTAGKKMTAKARVENTGDAADIRTVNLTVNGEVVDTKDVALGPGEAVDVTFEYRPEEPGVYRVEAGGREQSVTVGEPKGANMTLIALVVILLIAIGAGAYLYKTGELEGLKKRLGGR